MLDEGGKVDDLIIFRHRQGQWKKIQANKCLLNDLTELLCLLILLNLWYCDGVFYGGHRGFYTARLLFNVSKHHSEKLSGNRVRAEFGKVLHL